MRTYDSLYATIVRRNQYASRLLVSTGFTAGRQVLVVMTPISPSGCAFHGGSL